MEPANNAPDIIRTIELTAEQYFQAKHKPPERIILSKPEYQAYKEAEKEGRSPKMHYRGGEVKIPVSKIY